MTIQQLTGSPVVNRGQSWERPPRASTYRRREHFAALLYMSPLTVLFLGLLVYPAAYGAFLSFQETTGFEAQGFIGIDNYAEAILRDTVLHRAIVNTVGFTVVAILLQTGLGFGLAVVIAEVSRLRTLYRLVFFAPFVLSPVAVGSVWQWLYAPDFGPIGRASEAIGLMPSGQSFLALETTALAAVMVAFLWRYVGFNTVIYLAAMQNIPGELYDAARIDGAGWLARTRYITWPLLRPQTLVLVLLTTLGTMRIFDMMWIMTAGGPNHATETVSTHLYVTAFRFLQLGYGQAIAFILAALILLLAGFEIWLLRRSRATDE
jgi:ABC-type sugar transport system permease subunit